MRYLRYGIELDRLETRHLDMVRQWRNHERVRLRMRCKEEISPASQAKWFDTLDVHNDWYFVGGARGIPFGLFNVKEVQWRQKTGEAGGFVGNPRLIGGAEAGTAVLALMDFAFFKLGLEFLEATYRRDFRDIEALNRQLGYEVFKHLANGFVRARVSSARFLAATKKPRRAAEQLWGKEERLIDADAWLVQHIRSLSPSRVLL